MALIDNATKVSVLVDGLDHPEGIAWGPDGHVYAGGESGQLYRIDIERGEFVEFAGGGGFILGMALDARSNIYACDTVNHCIQKITPGGYVSTYSTGAPDRSLQTPNYPVFDPDGNLYVSDSGEWKADNGCIQKLSPGGQGIVWDDRLKEFPNGMCLSPDRGALYVVMSLNQPRVVRVAIEADGGAGAIDTVVQLPETVPDGLAFDTDGNLYISCYRPDRVYRLTPQGVLDILADDFEGTLMAAPTNVAFCGRGLDIFLSANLGRWHLTRYEIGATGLALQYPDLG